MNKITVFCGSSLGVDEVFQNQAYLLGQSLAKQNITLIYGGAKVGLMGKVADGALSENGEVIGVLPGFLKVKEIAHENLTKLIIVETMHERKMKMNELSNGIITLPGGFGSLEELFEMLTWAQLGLHKKPIGILNTNNFYDPMYDFLQTTVNNGFLKTENLKMLLKSDNINDLLKQMNDYIPIDVVKWIKESEF